MSFDPGDGTRGLRARVEAAATRSGRDPAATIGVAAGAVWLLLVVLFWLLGPSGEDGGRSGAGRLATLAGILLPLVLIAMAVGIARALAGLRAEARELRAQLALMRGGAAVEDQPAAADPSLTGAHRAEPAPRPPSQRQPAARRSAPVPTPARAAAKLSEPPQTSLDLGAPAAVDIAPDDLIAALNFPDGPDDHATIAALRRALTDPETARLIRAAQDVVTLLAARGLYMDDMAQPDVPAEAWRRFADGVRGAGLGGLADDARAALGDDAQAILSDALRGDEVFRDAAHHFLRQWDRLLGRAAPVLEDDQVLDLAATRSGRAFVALGAGTGIFS